MHFNYCLTSLSTNILICLGEKTVWIKTLQEPHCIKLKNLGKEKIIKIIYREKERRVGEREKAEGMKIRK